MHSDGRASTKIYTTILSATGSVCEQVHIGHGWLARSAAALVCALSHHVLFARLATCH